MTRKKKADVVEPKTDVIVETEMFNLFEIAEQEATLKAGQDIAASPKQYKDPFNRSYFKDNVLCVPFKVDLVLSIAHHLMQLQGVDFVPVAVIKTVAKELNLDLKMQGRSALSQIKTQCKKLEIGTIQDVEIKKGEQVASLSALVLNPSNVDKLKACRFSVLS